MLPSSRNSPKKSHTIVLQPRGVHASQPLRIGSKQEHFYPARGSPPQSYKHPVPQFALPPPHCMGRVQEEEHNNASREGNLLVRFGIDSMLGRMVTRVLIAFILFQPVYVAMGMELEEVPSAVETPVQSKESFSAEAGEEEQNTTEHEASIDQEQTENETEEVTDVVNTTQEDQNTVEQDVIDESTEETTDTPEAVDEENVSGDDTDSSASENEEGEPDGTDTTETEETTTTATGSDDIRGGEDEDTGTTEDTASTTEETEASEEEAVVLTQNSENKYTFNEGDCMLVADGEYYCVAEGPERQTSGDPRVYSEKDREGDREIYYFDGVEVHRITNNSYDDFAPMFEEETMRIVWQAMIQDRLQIMVHEIPTNTTRQITSSRQNSSNPSIIGDTVVWQEWVDTNWEIMMTDVDTDGQAFEVERLTDNVVHDMFPAAYDGLITWQSERGSSWEVVVYDMRTQKKQTLEKNENTKYENPRFALLFDSKHENGDVETIGYDLETGEMTELGTKANPKPFVPVTPREEVPEAIPQTTNATSTVSKEDSGSGDDPIVE
jgi:beta propeller repeat protein